MSKLEQFFMPKTVLENSFDHSESIWTFFKNFRKMSKTRPLRATRSPKVFKVFGNTQRPRSGKMKLQRISEKDVRSPIAPEGQNLLKKCA